MMFIGFQGLRDGNQVGNAGSAPAQAQNQSGTTARPGGSRLRLLAGDGDSARDGNRLLFRFYDNIPIQGPEEPCVGCNYRLTNRGFIRLP
ncbi:hypothetical protein B566_EDAN007538 [Ephemera danica]|nr:hypothetical protein B566_EDAN007538 [Ephemera danica]